MMKPRLFATILILLTRSAVAAPAVEPPDLHPTHLDTLRMQSQNARYEMRWDDAVRLHEEIFRQSPSDGPTLDEVARFFFDRRELDELREALKSGDTSMLPYADLLQESDIHLLTGLAFFFHDRNKSALHHFNLAMEARPDWAWAKFFAGLAKKALLEPREEYEHLIEAGLADRDLYPRVMLTYASEEEPSLHEHPRDFLGEDVFDALSALPWISHTLARMTLDYELLEKRLTFEMCEEIWADLVEKLGPRAGIAIYNLGYDMGQNLPAKDFVAFTEQRILDGVLADRWRTRLAEYLIKLGYLSRAEAVIGEKQQLWDSDWETLVTLRRSTAAPESCLEAVHELSKGRLTWSGLNAAKGVLRDVGEADAADDLERRTYEEDPRHRVVSRIFSLLATDTDGALGLIDSLEASGANVYRISQFEAMALESQGDTISIEEIGRRWPGREGAELADMLSDYARMAGDYERGRRLELFARLILGDTELRLVSHLQSAVEANQHEYAEDFLRRLEQMCNECPAIAADYVLAHLRLRKTEEASELVRRYSEREDLSPWHAATLAVQAQGLGMDDVTDRMLEEILEAGPRWPFFRSTHAWILIQRRQLDEARRVLEELTKEFPGSSQYQSLLVSASGEVAPLDAFGEETPDDVDVFSGFDEDFDSTDWIMERRARADSMENVAAAYLKLQYSYACNSLDRYSERIRETVQILSDEAVDWYQTMSIEFRPTTGVPRVRLARVVQPDGSVTEVPRGDIVVSAVDDPYIDVSDARQVIVPFPDLRVGATIDFVYEIDHTSLFGTGWSFRQIFGAIVPSMEEILELKMRRGLPFSTYVSEGSPEPEQEKRGAYDYYRWTLHDLEPLEIPESTVSLYELYPWVGCTTHRSWESAADRYRKDLWDQVQVTEEISELAAELTAEAQSDEEKLQALFAHVTDQVEYLAIELGRGAVVPTPASEVLERGYGDCKDMVTCLLSLFDASGLEASPVLVTPLPGVPQTEDFADLSSFTHMILNVRSVGKDVFCDPTTEAVCYEDFPPDLGSVVGLRLPRSGSPELVKIPPARSEAHGFDTEVDLEPTSDKKALVRVRSTFKGGPAGTVRSYVALADTEAVSYMVDRFLASGLWSTCKRMKWAIERDECGIIELTATYLDTAWGGEAHSVNFTMTNEVADPFLVYPQTEDRETPVLIPYPFEDTFTLRLHSLAKWEPNPEVATLSVKGDGYEGKIEAREVKDADDRYFEIRQQFKLEETVFPKEKYEEFHADWMHFLAGVSQPYTYHRILDAEEIQRLTQYASENPDDFGFAVQAASKILGNDVGGGGEGGKLRRQVAKEILAPVLDAEGAGILPLIIMGGILMEEGRYVVADSLIEEAVRREPGNIFAQGFLLGSKTQLGDIDRQIDILNGLVTQYGSEEIQLQLIQALYAARRIEEAHRAEARFFALRGDSDSSRVRLAQLQGHIGAWDCDKAREVLSALEESADPSWLEFIRITFFIGCGEPLESLPVIEEAWSGSPVNPLLCNNLAWTYALLGKNLEQAEELVSSAIVLSDDPSAAKNTLGAIYARRGDWQKARGLFEEIKAEDDRPSSRIVNDYFIGLCDYEMGRKEEAVARWREALEIQQEEEWRDKIRRSLELAEEGKPVTGVIFVDVEEES